jgi:TRAP-type mannitol/chloroaromatic compound transport system substrate-binding protein
MQAGVKVKEFSSEIMKAAYKAAVDLYVDEAGKNPAFKKIYVEYDKYRRTQSAWFSLAERRMDGFLQTGK